MQFIVITHLITTEARGKEKDTLCNAKELSVSLKC